MIKAYSKNQMAPLGFSQEKLEEQVLRKYFKCNTGNDQIEKSRKNLLRKPFPPAPTASAML